MAADISGVLTALKTWKKAVKKLRKKGQSWESREQRLERATERVLTYLSQEAIADEIDDLIQHAIATDSTSPDEVRDLLMKYPEPLVSVEMRTVHPLSVSRKDLAKLISTFLQTPDEEKPIADSEHLKAAFAQLSEAIAQQHRVTLSFSRKPKKRRRRDLMLGTLHTAIGVGLLVGNTQVDHPPADYSYILGGNALRIAMENFVGQLETTTET